MKYFSQLLIASFFFFFSCKPTIKQNEVQAQLNDVKKNEYVLAQWTFHKDLFSGKMSNVDFINIAAELGFVGVEYVNQFFYDKVDDDVFLSTLADAAKKANIKNTLLMVDRAGNLGASESAERQKAVEEHKRWIVAASKLGCPNIRVNAHGDGTAEEMMSACFESVKELAIFGKNHKVGIIIENHGMYSSDGKWLSTLVGKLFPYGVGSLADFDNWCIEREGGELWGAPCINEYDRYQGMKELLPTAKSVSLKAFDFDENGNAVKTDFTRMFQLIKESNYDEYLAVEFEGSEMDPLEGVKKTLLLVNKLNK